MASGNIEARIQQLEDIEAVKRLQAKFCYVNDSFDWKGTVDLFTDDAVAEYGPFGSYNGKAEITKFCRDELPKGLSFLQHMIHNPLVDVSGDKAKGSWYFETPATQIPTKGVWIAGRYDGEYVKVSGEWKISKLAVTFFYITPYEDGWAKNNMAQS